MSLYIYYFDVGQGDSILIEMPSKKLGIIDSNKIDGKIPALEFIKNRENAIIEFLCITHPHKDHYNGMLELIEYCYENKIPINNICESPFNPSDLKYLKLDPHEQEYYFKLKEIISDLYKENYSQRQECSFKSLIYEEDNLKLLALSPFKQTTDRIMKNQFVDTTILNHNGYNYFSIALIMKYNNIQMLFLSDLPKSEQKKLIGTQFLNIKSLNNIKISHHGSREYFLPNLAIDYLVKDEGCAVISAGCVGEKPSPYVLGILMGHKIKTYCTNAWKLTKGDATVNIPGLSDNFKNYLRIISQPGYNKSPQKPYHGDIIYKIDDNGISESTSTGRAPIL